MHILVVDQELSAVCAALMDSGHVVTWAPTVEAARSSLFEHSISVVLLDPVLANEDGHALLKDPLLEGVPVIVYSARVLDSDIAFSLDQGADAYVTKPSTPLVLHAHANAVIRRYTSTPVLDFGDLIIDVTAQEVLVRAQPISLTSKEFDLLVFLAKSPRHVFTRRQLLKGVWLDRPSANDASVTEHVRRLRLKLETDPDNPRWIVTVRGVGYRFERRDPR